MAAPLASDPRNNNTDGDPFDDGVEDSNFNGIVDPGETDPTRIEDDGDADEDGIPNYIENITCTKWDVPDTDFGGLTMELRLMPTAPTRALAPRSRI